MFLCVRSFLLLFHSLTAIIIYSALLYPNLLSASPPSVCLHPHCLSFFFPSLPNSVCSTVSQFGPLPNPYFFSSPSGTVLYQRCLSLSSHQFHTTNVFSLKNRSPPSSALPIPSSPRFHLLLSFILPSTKTIIFHSSTSSEHSLLGTEHRNGRNCTPETFLW